MGANSDDDDEPEDEEGMQARHKRELKSLEDKGRAWLKEARKVKGEKGKQKVQETEALLAREKENLEETHREELEALRDGGSESQKVAPDSQKSEKEAGGYASQAVPTAAPAQDCEEDATAAIERKKAKAQRKKDSKAQRERAHEEEKERERAAAGPNLRLLENERLAKALKPLGFQVHEIAADGNCLYRAINHQLALRNSQCNGNGYEALRKLAAKTMREHQSDFVPFLMDVIDIDKDGGDLDAAFTTYCSRVENSADWGGQPEIMALSRALESAIWIHDGDGGLIKMGEEYGEPLHISYHRHYLSVGEHYNSVVPC